MYTLIINLPVHITINQTCVSTYIQALHVHVPLQCLTYLINVPWNLKYSITISKTKNLITHKRRYFRCIFK